MGECWSCGAQVGGLSYMFTCPACAETAVMKDIRKGVLDGVEGQERAMQMIASGLSNVTDAVTSGLSGISDELSNLAGIVQGGFDELKWELQQQTQVLLSIDQTLKTPSQTQAREWREMAEQLRSRGCFDEAEEWFLKSLEMSPLDFRTYIGLGMTYLRKKDFDQAEIVLKKSFPHAPQGMQSEEGVLMALIRTGQKIGAIKKWRAMTGEGLEEAKDYVDRIAARLEKTVQGVQPDDYKSLSHLLIGRIYACRGDYWRAVAELQLAIDLSPNYPEGNYDYALYAVQSGKTSGWEEPLRRAIFAQPGYFNVARVERRFAPVRQELEKFLSGLLDEAYKNADQEINGAETRFTDAQTAVANAPDAGRYATRVSEIAALITTTKSDLVSKDYVKILKKVPADATHATYLSYELAKDARESSIAFSQEMERRQREAREAIPRFIGEGLLLGLVLGVFFGIGGCMVSLTHNTSMGGGFTGGFLLGIIVAAFWKVIEYGGEFGEKK